MVKKYKGLDEDADLIHYEQIEINDEEQKELEEKQMECCVAYIDIIGFKNMIDEDSHLPVLALRFIKHFINVFYHSLNDERGEIDNIDEELNADALPKATMFSDSIVISQPILEVDYPLFIELIAQLQFGLFSKGILIRGGICYGELYHDENYLFGKGLIKAYQLESEQADYPRIVVDADLINKIHEIVDKRFDESWRSYSLIYGERHYYNGFDDDEGDYSIYVRKDFDDAMYINYFAKIIEFVFTDFDVEPSRYALINLQNDPELKNAKRFIEEGLKTKNHRILTKYEWLFKLYNSSIREAFLKRKIEGTKILNCLLIQQ